MTSFPHHTSPPPRATRTTAGERHEFGRDNTPADGQRVLYGPRISGEVGADVAAHCRDHAYVVERELEQDRHAGLPSTRHRLPLQQASELAAIPLAVSPVDRYFEHFA